MVPTKHQRQEILIAKMSKLKPAITINKICGTYIDSDADSYIKYT